MPPFKAGPAPVDGDTERSSAFKPVTPLQLLRVGGIANLKLMDKRDERGGGGRLCQTPLVCPPPLSLYDSREEEEVEEYDQVKRRVGGGGDGRLDGVPASEVLSEHLRETRKMQKRERNKESARLSRERRNEEMAFLRARVEDLERSNAEKDGELSALKGQLRDLQGLLLLGVGKHDKGDNRMDQNGTGKEEEKEGSSEESDQSGGEKAKKMKDAGKGGDEDDDELIGLSQGSGGSVYIAAGGAMMGGLVRFSAEIVAEQGLLGLQPSSQGSDASTYAGMLRPGWKERTAVSIDEGNEGGDEDGGKAEGEDNLDDEDEEGDGERAGNEGDGEGL